MDTNNRYKKKLQDPTPPAPQKWAETQGEEPDEKAEQQKMMVGMLHKGPRRWKGLPEPVDVSCLFICLALYSFIHLVIHAAS